MTDEANLFDEVQYPAQLYPQTHPSVLGALARLHGLAAPDPDTARVLEVAAGDGINLLAMAAAAPAAQFLAFDLSAKAIERGQTLRDLAGIANARIEVRDVIEAAETMAETFDYVVVHGLYSWQAPPIREAMFRLIDRVLAPEGVAFVSYNTTPGGWMRLALREMIRFEMGQGSDRDDAMRRARAFIADYTTPRDDDNLSKAGMRHVARPMLDKSDGDLFHDELAEGYRPASFSEAIAHAAAHDLAFLGDALPAMAFAGMPGLDPDDEAEVLRRAQEWDYRNLAFFHCTLFVRPGRKPLRRFEAARFAELFAASRVRRIGRHAFQVGDTEFELDDDPLCDFLELLGRTAPARQSLAPFAGSQEHCDVIMQLYQRGILHLHASPGAAVLAPGAFPLASPLARAQIAAGHVAIFTLAHETIPFREPGPRAFLALLDGTRDRAALAADWAATPYAAEVAVDDALAQLCAAGLLIA